LIQRLLEGDSYPLLGAVLDPSLGAIDDLQRELRARKLEAVLDTQALELATVGGFARPRLQKLPWAGARVHTASDVSTGARLEFCERIAKFASAQHFTGVLAPTHLISGPDDPWFEVDLDLASCTRRYLDANGGADTLLYYLLAVPSGVFRDSGALKEIVDEIAGLDLDGVFLRVHPFGQDAGAFAVRRYITACEVLHELGLPLIADRVGFPGLALLAFGAVGAITLGVSQGEKSDATSLSTPPKPKDPDKKTPFGGPRVYVEALGAYLSQKEARAFFAPEKRTRARFGCKEKHCCPNGAEDTIRDPKRHLFHARMREVDTLKAAPTLKARVDVYMNDILRPAADLADRAAEIEPAFRKARKRLADTRDALRVIEKTAESRTSSRAPSGHRHRSRRTPARGGS
jgi:hypothetical protein